MRSLAISLLAVMTAGCAGLPNGPDRAGPPPFQVEATATPFVRVTAGPVSGLVPGGWAIAPLDAGSRSGFVASPQRTHTMSGVPLGLTAAWIDATEVGVPSDFYYLAATGSALGSIPGHPACQAHRTDIYVDHSPAFMAGAIDSPGDFVARVRGTCRARGLGIVTRWSSFVAAPGFGPARTLGIPASGLYVVTAIAPAGPQAGSTLAQLMTGVRFGGARMGDFVRAVGPAL
jgi:hypothetical protein